MLPECYQKRGPLCPQCFCRFPGRAGISGQVMGEVAARSCRCCHVTGISVPFAPVSGRAGRHFRSRQSGNESCLRYGQPA